MQSRTATPPRATRLCWICGRPVPLENSETDEYGSIVHPECQACASKTQRSRIVAAGEAEISDLNMRKPRPPIQMVEPLGCTRGTMGPLFEK